MDLARRIPRDFPLLHSPSIQRIGGPRCGFVSRVTPPKTKNVSEITDSQDVLRFGGLAADDLDSNDPRAHANDD